MGAQASFAQGLSHLLTFPTSSHHLNTMPELAYVGRFDGSNSKHASPAMAAAGAGAGGTQEDVTALPTSTKWSVLSSRIEGLAMEMCQVVSGMDAYCVSMSNAEGPAMKAVREKCWQPTGQNSGRTNAPCS